MDLMESTFVLVFKEKRHAYLKQMADQLLFFKAFWYFLTNAI